MIELVERFPYIRIYETLDPFEANRFANYWTNARIDLCNGRYQVTLFLNKR